MYVSNYSNLTCVSGEQGLPGHARLLLCLSRICIPSLSYLLDYLDVPEEGNLTFEIRPGCLNGIH